MKRLLGLNKRMRLLLGLLAVLLGALAVSWFEARAMRDDFAPVASSHRQEQMGPGLDVVSTTTVTREYGVVGDPVAKVAVFVRDVASAEEGRIQEIDYYYRRQGERWELTESGTCLGDECQQRGRDAFDREARAQSE